MIGAAHAAGFLPPQCFYAAVLAEGLRLPFAAPAATPGPRAGRSQAVCIGWAVCKLRSAYAGHCIHTSAGLSHGIGAS